MTGRHTLTTFSAMKMAVMVSAMVAMAAAVIAFREIPYEGHRFSASFAAVYLNFLLVVIVVYTPVLIAKLVWALQRRPAVFIEDGVLRSFPWGTRRHLADIASVHDERTNFWTGNVVLVLKDGGRCEFATREYAIRADELAHDIAASVLASRQVSPAG